jgi:hypothetical protein
MTKWSLSRCPTCLSVGAATQTGLLDIADALAPLDADRAQLLSPRAKIKGR